MKNIPLKLCAMENDGDCINKMKLDIPTIHTKPTTQTILLRCILLSGMSESTLLDLKNIDLKIAITTHIWFVCIDWRVFIFYCLIFLKYWKIGNIQNGCFLLYFYLFLFWKIKIYFRSNMNLSTLLKIPKAFLPYREFLISNAKVKLFI